MKNVKWENIEPVDMFGVNTYCYYEDLSNGQVLGVYFQHDCEDIFNCAVTIQDSIAKCDEWLCIGGIDEITGRCGIEGLVRAYRIIKWFIEHRLPDNCRVIVQGYDKKGSAYRYLTRLGFEIDVHEMFYSFFKKSYFYTYKKKSSVS